MNLEKTMKEYAQQNQIPVMLDAGEDFLIKTIVENNCHSFLEIGTAIAKTSIAVSILFDDMHVVTIERNQDMINQAKINIANSAHPERITLIEGDALDVDLGNQMFDCIFIDAAKAQYIRFFEKYAKHLNENGIIITDNMLFHGFVENPELTHNRNTRQLVGKIRRYHDYLHSLEEYETELFHVGDGVSITRRKK
ncbi:MAG: O-methyltransferase [Holdemanella sp.]|nr:O-methyltransferase [Holdemanella sp.]